MGGGAHQYYGAIALNLAQRPYCAARPFLISRNRMGSLRTCNRGYGCSHCSHRPASRTGPSAQRATGNRVDVFGCRLVGRSGARFKTPPECGSHKGDQVAPFSDEVAQKTGWLRTVC